mmetsp:Transcript_3810/g.5959  ORF Transcript_3810/g.5959 Transcript_3810/m.5959 type:complete len:166 (+) Transcript_3810:34-531(+)
MLRIVLVFIGVIVSTVCAMDCPSSDAAVHAGCEMTTTFGSNSCSDVKTEVLQRINGQYDKWHDPHNNGTYSTKNTMSDSVFDIERLTGDGKYTDKIRFTFEDTSSGCSLSACSQSQVFSIGDFSTNYCNSHDLYCSDEGCAPFSQLKYTESFGKCTSHDDVCLTM